MLDLFNSIGAEFARPLASTRGLAIAIASGLGLGLVLAASFVRTMSKLRTLTVLSNFCLLFAAALAPNPTSIVMFCVLIPINTWRLVEIRGLTRRVTEAAQNADLSGLWLKPYMKAHRIRGGTELFHKGDAANELYLLVQGTLELVEIQKRQPRGELFGEISFFSPERRRTLTARCVTDCEVLSIGESTFRQLYFQSPKFAFLVANLLAQRLSADIGRLQVRIAQLEAVAASERRIGTAPTADIAAG
jgi:CRP/FNR family transcriptional regulator, cyclic AMP receptor protein